jgi:flagellar protein FliO/FliZ
MLELVLRLVVSLGVVLGLFWAFARTGSRRMGAARSTLRLRGRQALGRSASVAVVEVGSRVLVIGVGEGGVRLLTELDPDELAVPGSGRDDDTDDDTGNNADDNSGPGSPLPGSSSPVSPLGGSLLAPQTWKQAWAAATSKAGIRPAARSAAGEPLHD